MNTDISNQPVFYLFIAFTLLLTLGYSWGRRRNRKIHLSAFNALVETVQPKDQNFTNIGGLTGYHANLIPKQNAAVKRLDATITLLARQSWLYFPISLLTRRFDRLFLSLSLTRKAAQGLKEGHLIEQGYARFRAPKIQAAERLAQEALSWGGHEFFLYYEEEAVKALLKELIKALPEPGTLRHVALVPDKERIFIFIIPRYGSVREIFPTVYRWIVRLAERQQGGG